MNLISNYFRASAALILLSLVGCVAAPDNLSTPIKSFTRDKLWDNWSTSVATFNIWGLPILSKNIEERMPAIAQDLKSKNFDFVMLEEAWVPKHRKLLEKKSGLGYSQNYSVPRTVGSGLFNLSSVPISRASFREFTLNGYLKDISEADAYAGKGASMATVTIRGLPISFFSTHLIARYNGAGDRTEDEHTVDRLLQLFEVFRHIVEQTDSDAFVVAGDFNIRSFQTEYSFWLNLTSLDGFRAEEADSTFCTYCGNNSFHQNSEGQLDYIFISPRLEISKAQLDFNNLFKSKSGKMINLSDHYGLSAKLKVRNSPSLIGYETAKSNCLKSIQDLKTRLLEHLDIISLEVRPKGIEDRICRSCRVKEGVSALAEYERALLAPLSSDSTKIVGLRTRLESYFDLFND